MITSRNLIKYDLGVAPSAQPQPAQTVVVRHKIKTSPGDLFGTVTLEAVDNDGAVVRVESFRMRQPVMLSAIISRQQDFIYELTAEGYQIKN